MSTAVADQLIPANPCTIPRAMNPTRKREPYALQTATGTLSFGLHAHRANCPLSMRSTNCVTMTQNHLLQDAAHMQISPNLF